MSDAYLINFIAAGFTQSLENEFRKQNQSLDEKMATLLEQINELKNGIALNDSKIAELTAASTEERTQVEGLVSVVESQQETIAQQNAKVQELLAQLEAGNSDNTVAIAELSNLVSATTQQSTQIESAIATVKGIYEPTV